MIKTFNEHVESSHLDHLDQVINWIEDSGWFPYKLDRGGRVSKLYELSIFPLKNTEPTYYDKLNNFTDDMLVSGEEKENMIEISREAVDRLDDFYKINLFEVKTKYAWHSILNSSYSIEEPIIAIRILFSY